MNKRVYPFDAFISYSQIPDKGLAISLREALMELGAKKYLLQFRSLEIFRDESSTAGNKPLSQKIREGIDQSNYLILLARPENAAPGKEDKKNWVEEEIEYFIASKYGDLDPINRRIEGLKIIICLVDGEIFWDYRENVHDFDWAKTNCLHPCLKNRFIEPVWVDLRGVKTKELENPTSLSLQYPLFKQKVAEISSKIKNISVDDLIADDIRYKRLWSALLGSAFAAILVLMVVAIVLGADYRKEENIAKQNLGRYKIEEFARSLRDGRTYFEAQNDTLACKQFSVANETAHAEEYEDSALIKSQLNELNNYLKLCNCK